MGYTVSRSHPKWVCSFPFALKLYRRLDSICTESPVKHGCDGNNFDIHVDDDLLTAFIVKYIRNTLIENYSYVCSIPNCYKTTMYIYHHQQKTIYIVYTIFTNYTIIIASSLWTAGSTTLQWRHNGLDDVSDHQPHDCSLNRLFRRRSKKMSKLRETGLCAGNSPVTGEFLVQRAIKAENFSIWWRHHAQTSALIMSEAMEAERPQSFLVLHKQKYICGAITLTFMPWSCHRIMP